MLKLGMDTSNSSTRDSLSLLSSQHSKEVRFQPSEKSRFSFWLLLMIDNKLKSEINSSPKWFLVSVFITTTESMLGHELTSIVKDYFIGLVRQCMISLLATIAWHVIRRQ